MADELSFFGNKGVVAGDTADSKVQNPLEFSQPRIQEGAIRPSVSSLEAIGAAFDLGRIDTATNLLSRAFERERTGQDEPLIEPAELNRIYQNENLEAPFNRPLTKSQAEDIINTHKKRQILSQKIASGPQNWGQSLANFGAGMVAHAIDPVELGASVLTGYGIGVAAEAGVLGARAARIAAIAAKNRTAGQAFAVNAMEGVLGNAAIEPVLASQQIDENVDYNAADAFMSVVGGGIGFPFAVYGLGQTAKFMKRFGHTSARYFDMPNIARVFSDRVPDGEFYRKDLVHELYAPLKKDLEIGENFKLRPSEHVEVPLRDVADASTRTWYSYTTSAAKEFSAKDSHPIEIDIGTDISHFTTDPGIAYNAANRKMFDNPGTVFAHKIDSTGFLNFEAKLPENLKQLFIDAAMETGLGKRIASDLVDKSPSIRDLYAKIEDNINMTKEHQGVFDRLKQKLVDSGVNGYVVEGGRFLGEEGRSHNSLAILNEKAVRETIDRFSPKKEDIHMPDSAAVNQKLKQFNEPSELITHNPKTAQEFDDLFQRQIERDPNINSALNEENLLKEELKSLGDQGLDPANQAIKVASDSKILHEANKIIRKALGNCFLKG